MWHIQMAYISKNEFGANSDVEKGEKQSKISTGKWRKKKLFCLCYCINFIFTWNEEKKPQQQLLLRLLLCDHYANIANDLIKGNKKNCKFNKRNRLCHLSVKKSQHWINCERKTTKKPLNPNWNYEYTHHMQTTNIMHQNKISLQNEILQST